MDTIPYNYIFYAGRHDLMVLVNYIALGFEKSHSVRLLQVRY